MQVDLSKSQIETALKGFENVMRVKNDHAFAYYYAAKCCRAMNLNEKHIAYKAKYEEIIKESAFWRNHANQFSLAALD